MALRENLSSGFPTTSDKTQAELRWLWIQKVEGLYFLCSEIKGTDHRFCFQYAKSRFSHEAAHLYLLQFSLFIRLLFCF